MREATIATSLLIDFLGFLGRRGLAAETVFRAAQIDPSWVDDPNSRVPAAAMERLWAAAEQLTGDADLGLHSAQCRGLQPWRVKHRRLRDPQLSDGR
ncbi:AraC family transcriptional regulator ligand-binding domain-containing protein [Polaromonas sp. CG_9.7]|uniref:AraC family transcriptional regulator ligand-binding domain-containing protein n=1 Tax=unclassified Polaromonas TaxID=2638319 RepID=UPI00351C0305